MYQKNKIIKSQKLKVRKSEMSLIRSKKENRLINNNPRLNSFRTFIQNNIIPKIKKNKKSYTSKPSFKK